MDNVPRWKDVEEALDKLPVNISAEVKEKLRRITAPRRHEARAQAAWGAALEWTYREVEEFNDAAAAALCYCEVRGLHGGGLQSPGDGTTRHQAFERLGKGRRKASDGGAWTAAIGAAPGMHGWHLVGWECSGEQLYAVMTGPHTPDLVRVDVGSILAWHQIETLVLGLVQDGSIDPIAAAAVLQWCHNTSKHDDHPRSHPAPAGDARRH